MGEALVHVTLNGVDWYAAPEVITVRAGQIFVQSRPTQSVPDTAVP